MPQGAVFEILLPPVRIDDRAVVCFRHGVDGEIPAFEIFFKRNVGRRVELKAVVPSRRLAFGTGKRMLFVRRRVQKHRKIGADGEVARLHHAFRRCADDDPIDVACGKVVSRFTQEAVTNGTAHAVALKMLSQDFLSRSP